MSPASTSRFETTPTSGRPPTKIRRTPPTNTAPFGRGDGTDQRRRRCGDDDGPKDQADAAARGRAGTCVHCLETSQPEQERAADCASDRSRHAEPNERELLVVTPSASDKALHNCSHCGTGHGHDNEAPNRLDPESTERPVEPAGRGEQHLLARLRPRQDGRTVRRDRTQARRVCSSSSPCPPSTRTLPARWVAVGAGVDDVGDGVRTEDACRVSRGRRQR